MKASLGYRATAHPASGMTPFPSLFDVHKYLLIDIIVYL